MLGTGLGDRVKVRFRCACRIYQGVVQVFARQFQVGIASARCPNCGGRLEQKKARFQLAGSSEPLTIVLVPVEKTELPPPLPHDPRRNYCGTCQEENMPLYPYKGRYRVCERCLKNHRAEDSAPKKAEDDED